MKKTVLPILLLLCSFNGFCNPKDEAAIRHMLVAQVDQWNQGNVAGYMHGYWENDSLVFIGKNGPRYGYQSTLASYQKAYPDAAHMGKLVSTIISMQPLSPDYYFIVGKWELIRSVGNLSGSYTLLLHKIKGEWVIIVDHSS